MEAKTVAEKLALGEGVHEEEPELLFTFAKASASQPAGLVIFEE